MYDRYASLIPVGHINLKEEMYGSYLKKVLNRKTVDHVIATLKRCQVFQYLCLRN